MSETTAETTETDAPQADAPPIDAPEDVTDAPEADDTDPRVKRANAQAAKYRTDLRAQEAKVSELEATLSKLAAVFNPDSTTTDPAEQVASVTAEAEGLRTEVSQLRAELLVHNLASDAGGNPAALLDSREFTTTLHRLDATADDYSDQVSQAIAAAVAKNDRYAAQGQGPSRGGAEGAGQGPTTPGTVTQAQFDTMSYKDRVELHRTNPALYRRLAGTA